jgi:hypothetical protein
MCKPGSTLAAKEDSLCCDSLNHQFLAYLATCKSSYRLAKILTLQKITAINKFKGYLYNVVGKLKNIMSQMYKIH